MKSKLNKSLRAKTVRKQQKQNKKQTFLNKKKVDTRKEKHWHHNI
jgi:hypothetical protein